MTACQKIRRIFRCGLGLALLLGLAGLARAEEITDPALLALLQRAPAAKDYPDADAVWLLRDMEITVEPSGAFNVHERKLIKILTPQGLSLAQWEIPYDKATEEVSVRTARTLVRTQAFPADPAQVVESTVYPGMAWYDSMIVRRFPLPAAVPGAVLEVDTDHRRLTPRVPGAFSTRLYLRQRYPVREARFTIRVPETQHLAIRFTGGAPPPVAETVAAGSRVYRWSAKDLPAVKFQDPQLPSVDDLVPSAHITSLTSWAPVVAWYRQITDGKDTVTDDLRRVARERTAGCKTLDEKIAALHKAVREIPYVALEMGELSDVPHEADAVARQNYGDCKDKATLLRALLQAVDIPADYVLARTTSRGELDPRQYGADEFNHVLLAVPTPHGDRFLDATVADAPVDQLPPGVDGAQGLVVRGAGQVVRLPASTAVENTTDVQVRVTVRADGSAGGTATLTFHGVLAILQRGMLVPIPQDRYRQALEGYLAPRLGAEVVIKSVTVDHVKEPERPLVITATFTSPCYLERAGEQYSGYLPGFTYQQNPYRATAERPYPFFQMLESRVHLETTITLPPAFQVSHLPTAVKYASTLGRYQDVLSVKDHQLHYICDLVVQRGSFPPTMLAEMRKWSAVLAQEGRNKLQFFLRRK